MNFTNSGMGRGDGIASRNKPVGRKAGIRERRRTASSLEQPIAESAGAMPCRLCGHPVDPKRMHFHMVRCHGAAFCAKDSQLNR